MTAPCRRYERLDTTVSELHFVVSRHIADLYQKVSELDQIEQRDIKIHRHTWSNDSGIILGSVSVYIDSEPVEGLLGVSVLEDRTNITSEICHADVEILLEIMDKDIYARSPDNLKDDVNSLSSNAVPELLNYFRTLLISSSQVSLH